MRAVASLSAVTASVTVAATARPRTNIAVRIRSRIIHTPPQTRAPAAGAARAARPLVLEVLAQRSAGVRSHGQRQKNVPKASRLRKRAADRGSAANHGLLE